MRKLRPAGAGGGFCASVGCHSYVNRRRPPVAAGCRPSARRLFTGGV